MSNKPICAIAVFNDKIKCNVKFTEDLASNRIFKRQFQLIKCNKSKPS